MKDKLKDGERILQSYIFIPSKMSLRCATHRCR